MRLSKIQQPSSHEPKEDDEEFDLDVDDSCDHLPLNVPTSQTKKDVVSKPVEKNPYDKLLSLNESRIGYGLRLMCRAEQIVE